MNLLEFLEDPRPASVKGRVIRIREPPVFVLIPPPRKPVVVPVKSSRILGDKESEKP